MTRVYLIRHAEAEGNIYRRAQGRYDGAVSSKGRRQIAELAERFRSIQVDALYSSDRARTFATAGAITKYHSLEIRPELRLREIDLGSWEDEPFGDLLYRDPVQMNAFNNDPAAWHVDGAETFGALYYAEIRAFGPLRFEIAEIALPDRVPDVLTYPLIQPKLIEEAKRRGFL